LPVHDHDAAEGPRVRRTPHTIRVSYGISPTGLAELGFAGLYLVATPRMKYSCSSYPTFVRSIGVE
jgi:hypothetical protein